MLVARLGLPAADRDLLHLALIHSSFLHEHPESVGAHNERLEFLGDAVVNLAVSEALYARHPDDDEGMLSARRATIVSTPGLSRLADRLELGDLLYLAKAKLRGAAGCARRCWRPHSRRSPGRSISPSGTRRFATG